MQKVNKNVEEYICKTPVIFIFFNRPDTMVKVLEQIKKVKPNILYLVSDGPRNADEHFTTERCRRIAEESITWECNVQKVYAEKNMGCRNRVASGINYVFEREVKAIILEDDCVPTVSFFRFMDETLEMYKEDNNIFLVTGRNMFGKYAEDKYDYFFAHHGPSWGWGTWVRSWKLYDIDMKYWPDIKRRNGGHLREWMGWKEWVCKKWVNEDTYNGKIDTWDYQMAFALQYYRMLCIVPSINMIRNIGDGVDATHTANNVVISRLPSFEMKFPMKHPDSMVVNSSYDKKYSRVIFGENFWRNYIFKIIKKFLKITTGKEYKRTDFFPLNSKNKRGNE